jgi:hypothetical protein
MVEIAAPAIVSTEDGADDDAAFVRRDEAQAGIANQKGCDGFARVGFIQTNAFARAP